MAKRLSPTEALGLALKQLRTERDVTQMDLAANAKVHRNHVGLIERAEISPSYDTVVKLADALGVKPSEVVALAERFETGR